MLRKLLSRLRRRGKQSVDTSSCHEGAVLCGNIDDNIGLIKDTFGNPEDLVVKEFLLGGRPLWRTAVVFLEGLSDETKVTETVIEPLMTWSRPAFIHMDKKDLFDQLKSRIVVAGDINVLSSLNDAIQHMLGGSSLVLCEGYGIILAVDNRGIPSRGVEQPTVEVTTRGPKVSFNEVLTDNIALIRGYLKTPDLANERMIVGRKSRTEVRLLYLRSIAHPELVQEVRRRLQSIDTDIVIDSGTIQKLIQDHPYSLFSTIRSTERPDSVVAELNEGRVAIAVDGSPFILVMPTSFYGFFTSPEDYYMVFTVASLLRVFRYTAFILSVSLTPLYVALTTYHPELIPFSLLLNIAATQAAVPFPTLVNAIGAEILIEVLREAGVRLPQSFGPAVSIVGALVLGQAAVQAAFISPGLVIVVTTATIASFAVPRSEAAISFRLLRFPFIIMSSFIGLYGLALGAIVTFYHLCSMDSFGLPFMTLYTPGRVSELGEKIVMAPEQVRRPVRPGARRDRVRRGPPPKPKDPADNGDTGGDG